MTRSDILLSIAKDPRLLEIGRLAIEDQLVRLRDSRIFQIRNNGLVIKESDGTDSGTIRMAPEDAVRTALIAIATYLEHHFKEEP